jgi:hypothetical protein
LLTHPQRKPYPFLEQDDPEQVRREAQRQAAFEAVMGLDRELQEKGGAAEDAVAVAVLMEQLEQPAAEKEREAAEKAKEAQAFTCGFCSEEYTQTHAAAAVAASTAMCFAVTRAGL